MNGTAPDAGHGTRRMDMSLYLAPSLRSGAHVECHVSTRFSLYGIGLTTDERQSVFQLRCTGKLHGPVTKAAGPGSDAPKPTTTKLGDWFANRFNFGAQRYIICTSELSLMTVLIPARDLSTVHERLKAAVEQTLVDLHVPVELRERELLEMGEFGIAKTNSGSVLGSLVDMGYMAEAYLSASGRLFELRGVNLRLAAVPCAPLKFQSPGERAAELLKGWQE